MRDSPRRASSLEMLGPAPHCRRPSAAEQILRHDGRRFGSCVVTVSMPFEIHSPCVFWATRSSKKGRAQAQFYAPTKRANLGTATAQIWA